ncbi:MAG: type II toxin-antitoxin system RelE/ParE family toxin [Verrucomicrobia bacterium]|nr:type II toxin-antitoxin system RelE/ParE family toxin [Verrucomicrobiota bacterium]
MNVTRASRFEADAAGIAREFEHPQAGLRFLDAVESAVAELARQPFLGRLRLEHGEGRRSWRVPGFGKWLIFYRVRDNSLQLQRVVYGARDLPRVLGHD